MRWLLVLLDNFYSGNPGLTSVNTNYFADAGDGIVYFQNGGNWFLARNIISNNLLEGIQFDSGPAAAVQNDFATLVSGQATVALNAYARMDYSGPTGQETDNFFSFVGNNVNGNRSGVAGTYSPTFTNITPLPYRLTVSGNAFNLSPAFDLSADYPGAAVIPSRCRGMNISGNTLLAGGHGVMFEERCTNAVILNNHFGAASHRAISHNSLTGSVQRISLIKMSWGKVTVFIPSSSGPTPSATS